MKTYQSFATALTTLLASDRAVRIIVEGYMPLSIERIGLDAEGRRQIAMAHTGEQNGDLMRDPELVFVLHEAEGFVAAEPISFRNDYVGVMQDVYRYDVHGRRTHVVPTLKRELKSFARLWLRNLRDQGFFGPAAKRERLT